MQKKTSKLFYIIIIILILLSGITYIILSRYYEDFSPLSNEYNEKKALSRTRLQFLINKSESLKGCNTGYIQPSNPCTQSFNTNFYPQYYDN